MEEFSRTIINDVYYFTYYLYIEMSNKARFQEFNFSYLFFI